MALRMSLIKNISILAECVEKNKLTKAVAMLAGFAAMLVVMIVMMFVNITNAFSANPRIKDIVAFEGIRENILVGYGLVVGLNGTGDKLTNSVFTEKSLQSFLTRMGVSTTNQQLKVKNVAAVIVTAKMPAFGRPGSKIDISVSTLGDARSLEGGTLIATPLMGADGDMYAVGQGPVAVGGFVAEGEDNKVTKGVPTTGYIADGAIIEREIPFELNDLKDVKLAMRNPDLTTAKKVEAKINEKLGDTFAKANDPGTISLSIPKEYANSVATLLAEIEQLVIETDQPAKIVIDEASGTVVINNNVIIDTVAVAQGNLVVSIAKTPSVSQPNSFAPEGSETVVTEQETVNVEEESGNITVLENNATLKDLVNGLNLMGVSTGDLITILTTIKHAGALHAEIVTR